MCDIIIRETNRKANQCYVRENTQNPTREQRTWKAVTKSEFDAYLGLLLLSSVTHSGYVHTTDLWKTTSHPIYRAAMSVRRFWAISRFIRFDNGNTRQQRKQTDKAAAIADIFLMLNSNLHSNYVAGANVTVDEQLYPFRGGTGFTQYIPSKPAKYGIKVWWVCDSISSYPLKGQIYTGMAASGQREKNVGERVVKDLCVNLFRGSGRNIVCDNFFTSYNLAKSLMMDSNLSMLGTVNKRRKFVPPQFPISKGRAVESTIFGFSNNITMCSYVPKKNKSVVVLSTMHYTTEVEGPKKKPLMILDYNKTKGGVDNMDKCLAEYSTKRRTNRWPLAFFYNILDVAAFAAYIIYVEKNPHLKASTNRRRMFLHQLSEQLAKPEIEVRANNSRISRIFSTRNAIEAIIGGPLRIMDAAVGGEEERDSTGRIKTKGNCYICAKRRPTRKTCTLCKRSVCAEHSTDMPQCNKCS